MSARPSNPALTGLPVAHWLTRGFPPLCTQEHFDHISRRLPKADCRLSLSELSSGYIYYSTGRSIRLSGIGIRATGRSAQQIKEREKNQSRNQGIKESGD